MTRLYDNRGLWRRSILLLAFLVLVMLYGVWELWSATRAPDATGGAMFGVLFLGGGLYAAYQSIVEWRDLVVSLDLDEVSGDLTATLWEPAGALTVTAGKGEFRNWRSHVKIAGRNVRTFFLYVDHPGHPRPLRFDLKPGTDVSGLRRIAPEAVAEFEAAAGRAKA